MIIVPILIIIVFVLLGIIFINGKGAFLIAGYNTMNKEEKIKYDKTALCRFMGKSMFALAFCMLFWIFGDLFNRDAMIFVAWGLFAVVIIFTVMYLNTKNRFKK
jgi:hypothetical protein